ncbi:BTAD domain-containing putative transcriptional regulator [Capillimicrobium parvum]|uniref:HTH-type transcriptional regulator MalT n=1 Tax=Capillimicrobium parvum TaxID=2884022 RepID=A0A9E7BZJ9_9ACTN|nr:BTAD domain-containing putative transcriptional regulator [Capillimicrobium parvum]UGS34557.1 HTH-type transcriptional regulator MalT [Capillimicrobium parvum]
MAGISATTASFVQRPELVARVRGALEHGSVGLVAGAGYGKTLLVEEALEGRTAAWLSCRGRDTKVDRLMVDALQAIRRAVPGAADVLIETVSTAGEAPSPLEVTRALLDELDKLLVEPLIFVIDDAEELADAGGTLRLLEQLVDTEHSRLRIVVCTRRPLNLRIARAQASGRITLIDESDLAFGAEESALVLESQLGRAPTDGEVDEVMQRTLGWPLGVVLGSTIGNSNGAIARFLAEEVLGPLDGELRAAMLASSAVDELTPAMSAALGLPADLANRLGRLGVLLRPVPGRPGTVAYHPLLHEHLREQWELEAPAEERARTLISVGTQLSSEGRVGEAVDAFLAARAPERALEVLDQHATVLVRTTPGGVEAWLDALPPELRADPRASAVAGRLRAAAGLHEDAVPRLRAAVAQDDDEAASAAAAEAAESLYWLGRLPEGLELLLSLERPTVQAQIWTAVLYGSSGRLDEATAVLEAVDRRPDAAVFAGLRTLAETYISLPDGRHEELLAALRRRLETLTDDRRSTHRPEYLAGFSAFTLGDAGMPDAGIALTDLLFAEAARSGIPSFIRAETHALRAFLLSLDGRTAEAEVALGAIGEGVATDGWAPGIAECAMAACLLARGERAGAYALAERAMARMEPAPLPFRQFVSHALVPTIAAAASPDRAHRLARLTLAWLEETYGPDHGSYHRARSLALCAWTRNLIGDVPGAGEDMRRALELAGDAAPMLVRAEWRRLEELFSDLMAAGELDPAVALDAAERVFPGGEELAGFAEHPRADVRARAARTLGSSGHPRAEILLDALEKDDDPEVVEAAKGARATGRRFPPSRTITLFGGFSLRRGNWVVDERAWGRPTTARLVRVLLTQRGAFMPEEELLEALWPDKPPKSARSSIQVAVSRARSVLDVAGAEQSVIQYSERAYRLVLDDRDRVDTELFGATAAAALVAKGATQIRLLETAVALWTGEPMPEERYSDWAQSWRENLVGRYAQALTTLVDLRGRAGNHAAAAAAAGRLVGLDPLDEGAQRLLITALARSGNRARALRQYLACRKQLVDELGIEPSEPTRDLQRRVLAGLPV